VHIDPENDESSSPSGELPSRSVLMAKLCPQLERCGVAENIGNIVLHYLGGKIDVEIYLNAMPSNDNITALIASCKSCESVGKVSVHQKII
jgi:hypothetical protein